MDFRQHRFFGQLKQGHPPQEFISGAEHDIIHAMHHQFPSFFHVAGCIAQIKCIDMKVANEAWKQAFNGALFFAQQCQAFLKLFD